MVALHVVASRAGTLVSSRGTSRMRKSFTNSMVWRRQGRRREQRRLLQKRMLQDTRLDERRLLRRLDERRLFVKKRKVKET